MHELAQRVANAAKEIKELITKSDDEVASGVKLVKATGDALTQISAHVTDINHAINSIATAANEQLTGIQEVESAVTQMDQMTQQNAAMVEETTAVTHRLAEDADGLAKLIGEFSIAGTAAAAAAPAPVEKPAEPVPSPARRMGKAFGFDGNAATVTQDDNWDEF